jgi:hypothetical protein
MRQEQASFCPAKVPLAKVLALSRGEGSRLYSPPPPQSVTAPPLRCDAADAAGAWGVCAVEGREEGAREVAAEERSASHHHLLCQCLFEDICDTCA